MRRGAQGTGRQDGADEFGPVEQVERRVPDEPPKLPKRLWWAVLTGTKEFKDDELTDRAHP